MSLSSNLFSARDITAPVLQKAIDALGLRAFFFLREITLPVLIAQHVDTLWRQPTPGKHLVVRRCKQTKSIWCPGSYGLDRRVSVRRNAEPSIDRHWSVRRRCHSTAIYISFRWCEQTICFRTATPTATVDCPYWWTVWRSAAAGATAGAATSAATTAIAIRSDYHGNTTNSVATTLSFF